MGEAFLVRRGSVSVGTGFPDGWKEQTVGIAGGNITKNDPIVLKRIGIWEDTINKVNDPSILPTGNGYGVSFSPDGNYLAVSHSSPPYLTIYKRNGDTFTKLSDPSILPTGNGYGVSFSPDGNYLAVSHSSPPYLTIYKRNEDTFTKLPNPSTLPTGEGKSVSFSSDGNYLAVAHVGSSSLTIYKRNGDTFTKLSDPSILPANNGYGVSFSPDGNYLAVASYFSPYLTIYKTDVYDLIQRVTSKRDYFNYSSLGWKLGVALESLSIGQLGKVNLFPAINNLPND